MEEGGRGGRVSPLGIDLARGERDRELLPSLLVHLSSLISSRALSYDRDHTRTLQRKSVVESHAHTFVHLPPEFPFGPALLRPTRSPAEDERLKIVGGGNHRFSTYTIVWNHRDASSKVMLRLS